MLESGSSESSLTAFMRACGIKLTRAEDYRHLPSVEVPTLPILRFADGVVLNTGGRYRLIKLSDAEWYVVGQGHFVPVTNREEGEAVWSRLTQARHEERG